MERHFYHFYTKGFTSETLFMNTREFIAGMNRIAVCWLACRNEGRPVRIFALCLMGNHVHFILYGFEEDCIHFLEKFKQSTGIWVLRHRKERLHEKIVAGHALIKDKDSLRKKIVYNLRQALEAGMNISPLSYRWSSGPLMFADHSFAPGGAKLASSYSLNAMESIVSSKVRIPDDWYILQDGMVWPGNYVEYQRAENVFKNLPDFMFCLNSSGIDKEVNQEIFEDLPVIPDIQIRDRANDLARRQFGKTFLSRCSGEERISIARILRKELHPGGKQLARVLGMDLEAVKKFV